MQSPFTPEQISELEKSLDPKRVKHRQGGGGSSLGYIEGHDAIDTANRIFKPGNWGYDLIETNLLNVIGENGDIIGGYYYARLRLTVRDCIPITEEGVCPIQEGRNPRARIDAHDMARKGAITDALKRALRCYGDQFGNSLYDRELVDGQPRQQAAPQATSRPVTQNQARPANLPAPASQALKTPPSGPVTPMAAPNLQSGATLANPREDKLYKHYSPQIAECHSLIELDLIGAGISGEIQDEAVKKLLRAEFGKKKEQLTFIARQSEAQAREAERILN